MESGGSHQLTITGTTVIERERARASSLRQ